MMRHVITVRRIIAAGFKSFGRNSWLSIAATAVMVVALVNMLAAVVLNITITNIVEEYSKNLKVSVYLQDDISEVLRLQLEAEFKQNQYVDEVSYISKEIAQKQFAESFQDDKKLLEGLALIGGNTLPASFEVSVTDLSKLEEVGNIAKTDTFKDSVESISLGKTEVKETIKKAANVQKFIQKISIGIAIVYAIISMLIIFNTIRMAIFTRSDEIRTQKLLGATRSYIRGPFLVESSIYGIIAGVIAASATYAAIFALEERLSAQAEFAESYQFLTDPMTIALMVLGTIAAGILVGVISSTLAIGRYLKLKNW
jgi:cell division transport system permease protein